jgi:hypothetical protein
MPAQEFSGNRHRLRVWIKWAIESGLLEKLPADYQSEGLGSTVGTERYARGLLAELRAPDLSKRTIRQIVADARQFQLWVEARQKDYRRLVLREQGSERAREVVPARTAPRGAQQEAIKPLRRSVNPANPRINPMWDDWLDA